MAVLADVLPLDVRQVSELSGPSTVSYLARPNFRSWPVCGSALVELIAEYRTVISITWRLPAEI